MPVQLFIEVVGTGGVGVIMEDGMVKEDRQAPKGKAKATKSGPAKDGALL